MSIVTENEELESIFASDPDPSGFTSAYEQLRPYEKVFVDAYLSELEFSATRAGRTLTEALGQVGRSYPARAREQLQRPLIRAAITQRVRELAAQAELSTLRVLREIKLLATSNIADYFDLSDGRNPIMDLTDCTREQLAAVKSIKTKINKDGSIDHEITLHDKPKSLDMMCRVLAMYKDAQIGGNVIDLKPVYGNPALYAKTLEEE